MSETEEFDLDNPWIKKEIQWRADLAQKVADQARADADKAARRPLNPPGGSPGIRFSRIPGARPSRSVTRSSLVVMTQVDASSRRALVSASLLRHPLHSGHLTVGALKRNKDKPVLFLGDTTLTGGQLAERISQYIQAFEALGAGTGAAVGLLSLNRPEVLMIIGAGQTQGYRRTALHPLGSLDDHAYVLNDAGITSLIIDPNPMFVERALGLLEKVPGAQADPDDRTGARGAGRRRRRSDRRGREVLAAAAGGRRPAAGSHRRHGLHRRHHRQAQGRDRHRAVDHHDDDDPARRVGVAGDIRSS